MIVYELEISKSGKIFHFISPQFTDINGYGMTEYEASADFFSKLHKDLNYKIAHRIAIPKGVKRGTKAKNKKGTGTFSLPLLVELTVMLHHTMLIRKVDQSRLARLLALTADDLKTNDYSLEKAMNIEPKAKPKYKNVQRLLNVDHHSSITEMSEAFRVLGCVIDPRIVSSIDFKEIN